MFFDGTHQFCAMCSLTSVQLDDRVNPHHMHRHSLSYINLYDLITLYGV